MPARHNNPQPHHIPLDPRLRHYNPARRGDPIITHHKHNPTNNHGIQPLSVPRSKVQQISKELLHLLTGPELHQQTRPFGVFCDGDGRVGPLNHPAPDRRVVQ